MATGRAILLGTCWIAVVACEGPPGNGAPARSKCGGPGSIAGLPPPAAVWTLASAASNFYTPRVADLEDDGSLEVVLAGGNEMPSFGEVIVLDAKTGGLRWRADADSELYSSPVLLDLFGNGVKDVFVAGRDATLMAFDGARARGPRLVRRDPVFTAVGDEQIRSPVPPLIGDQDGGVEVVQELVARHGVRVVEIPEQVAIRSPGAPRISRLTSSTALAAKRTVGACRRALFHPGRRGWATSTATVVSTCCSRGTLRIRDPATPW